MSRVDGTRDARALTKFCRLTFWVPSTHDEARPVQLRTAVVSAMILLSILTPSPEGDTVSLSPWGEGQGEGVFSFPEGPPSPPSPGAELDFVRCFDWFGRADLSRRVGDALTARWGEASSRFFAHCSVPSASTGQLWCRPHMTKPVRNFATRTLSPPSFPPPILSPFRRRRRAWARAGFPGAEASVTDCRGHQLPRGISVEREL